jgi:hypothetical protein
MKVVLTINVLILLVIAFLAGYPFDNMDLVGKCEILNEDKMVYTGEILRYRFTYKKWLNLPGELTKQLALEIENGEYSLNYKPFMGDLPTGEHTVTASIKIPNTPFVIGESKLVFNFKHPIFGGLRIIYDKYESEPFVIRGR